MKVMDLVRGVRSSTSVRALQEPREESAPASAEPAAATDTKQPSLQAFYDAILPADGGYVLFQNHRNDFFDTFDAFVAATERRIDTQGLYFGTATYGTLTKLDKAGRKVRARTQDNVLLLKALRIDIDAGAEKFAKHPNDTYPTQRDALAAFIVFVKATGLQPSLIVSSGEGLHVYWCLDQPVDPLAWHSASVLLNAVGRMHGLKIDAGCTADSARVLRPVGTLHKNGKRVALLKDTGKRWDFRELDDKLRSFDLPVEVAPAPRAAKPRGINDDVLKVEGPPASLARVAQHCSAVAAMRDSGGNVPEPHWRAVMGVAKYCEDGEQLVHEWSAGHPDYSARETQEKFDRWETPPTTCQHFSLLHTGCNTCQYRGKITTPKQVGSVTAAELESSGLVLDEESDMPPEIRELRKDYFVAPDGSGRPFIYREFMNPETGLPDLGAMSRSDFSLLMANRTAKVTYTKEGSADSNGKAETVTKKVPLDKLYLQSPWRREYAAIALLPELPTPPGTYNLWRGFGVQRHAGDVALMLTHVDMMCGGDAAVYEYLLNWLAFCVQRPGDRPEVAIVARGGRGTGKGTLFRLMLRLFGQHGLHITNARLLTGDFNGHMRGTLFLFADEAFWAGDKAGVGILNGYITEPTIAINGKGKDVFTAMNRLKIAFASNEDWVVPAGSDERRYLVIDVPSTRRGDHEYFQRLNAWIQDGGAAAWLDYLQVRDITRFDPRRVPSTAALDRQKIASLSAAERWVLDALEHGTQLSGAGVWDDRGFVLQCRFAARSYAEFARECVGRWAKPLDTRGIGAELNRLLGCGPARPVRTGGAVERGWQICGLSEARTRAARALGLRHYSWPAVTE